MSAHQSSEICISHCVPFKLFKHVYAPLLYWRGIVVIGGLIFMILNETFWPCDFSASFWTHKS